MSGVEFPKVEISLPRKFQPLLGQRARYKIFRGGRGGAKSESFARALVAKAHHGRERILCTREFQNSIADSVHRTVTDAIESLGMAQWFNVTQTSVKSRLTGSEFLYKGLQKNIQEIKSLKGITLAWVEEAQSMSQDSFIYLDPTIREDGSEIWFSYNPVNETDAVHILAAENRPNAIAETVNWRDNPWFPRELEEQRAFMLARDPDAYDWIWEGHCRKISAATVFKDRFVVESFETPSDKEVGRFFYGADWGYANDPSTLVRCWVRSNPDGTEDLMVDHEAYGIGVELDDLHALWDGGVARKTGMVYTGVPGAREWPIKADNARPETISYMCGQGFSVSAAGKWSGSIEDGVAHLKAFNKIVIHERCTHTAQEFRLYSYKTDPKTLDENRQPLVLPIIVDRWNHVVDALRYALDGYIQHRGGFGTWAKLAR